MASTGLTLAATSALSVMLALASGCQPAATTRPGVSNASPGGSWTPGKPRVGGQSNASARWPFWPVQMRIHPLTRLVVTPMRDGPNSNGQQWVIETRVEFQDADSLPSKATGQLMLQLYESPTMQMDQGRVKTWNINLRDLDVNRAHYDDVTRTYLFRLSIEPSELSDQSQLRATFESLDGLWFEDRLMVKH